MKPSASHLHFSSPYIVMIFWVIEKNQSKLLSISRELTSQSLEVEGFVGVVIACFGFSTSELWEIGAVEIVLKSTGFGPDALSSLLFRGKVQGACYTLSSVGRHALLTHCQWVQITWISFFFPSTYLVMTKGTTYRPYDCWQAQEDRWSAVPVGE